MKRICTVLVVTVIAAASCTTNTRESTTTVDASSTSTTEAPTTTATPPAPTTTTTAPASTTLPTTDVPTTPGALGATLEDIPLITDGTYPGPAWPGSLDGVAFADAVPSELRANLVENGFVIEPNIDTYEWPEALAWSTQFSSTYEMLSPYDGRAVFVTTDTGYHLWHQVFDMVLRDTEETRLLPILERLVGNLVTAGREQTGAAAGTGVEDAALRAQEHLEAAATVLGLEVGFIGERATAEVALVDAHTDLVASPTIGGDCPPSCVDYSLMKPRGHYTRSEDLERYFRAMSMLGNTMFLITDASTLRVGGLIARLITTDPDNAADWQTIYEPTSFLVGTADDYTPLEFAAAADTAIDTGLTDPVVLTDDATVVAIGEELAAMRPVRIDPGLAALRTMGARFVLDSWIYDQLTDPGVPDRIRPTPLDLASVMGSDYAERIQSEAGEPVAFPEYEPRVTELRDVTAARTIDDWGRTVYDGWLYALEPQWVSPHPDAFPPFMRGDAWSAKAHNTGFSSYAELKRDTILYAKQGIAEGDAPEPPPPPRHWVEPDPVSFARLSSLASMMRDGLIDAGLMLGDDYDTELGDPWQPEEAARWASDRLIDILDRWAAIAQGELEGDPITAEDNEWLSHTGGTIAWLLEAINRGEIEPTPIIADIFLDPFADEVLEVGTGPLDTIHVLVPDDAGRFQVATGPVYSYYEFWGPRSDRLNDQEWQDLIVAGDLPDRPSWWTEEHG